ncbi:MAG: hypothetical protein LWX07_12935 [Bacteroidetes bacterium]|nr:hypothetical protein [Bacteroidota bacterium]
MGFIIQRPRIEYLCYGQRSDYKCAPVSDDDDLWFYSFNDHNTGKKINEKNENSEEAQVMYCKAGYDKPNFVAKRLKSNTEQCRHVEKGEGNEWHGDSFCDWYIKPRIRIKPGDAGTHGLAVCNIKVIHQDGKTVLLNKDILAEDFLDGKGSYNGGYKEEFPGKENNMLIIRNRDWGNKWGYSARGTCSDDSKIENKADIQVYWYGKCDMWIDYIRVDNDVAHNLLNTDTTSAVHKMYEKWIYTEAQNFLAAGKGSGSNLRKFYIELAEFNNLPCISYVNSKLKECSDGKVDLIQDLTNTISAHVPWSERMKIENPAFLSKYYIGKAGYTQILAESYPLTGCHTKNQNEQLYACVPNTLPRSLNNGAFDSIIGRPVSIVEYEEKLHDIISHRPYCLEADDTYEPKCETDTKLPSDRGNFDFVMRLGTSISRMTGVPFIFLAQAHQWYRPYEIRREPTNEELNMMVNAAVSHGAKGVLYFCFNSMVENGGSYGAGIVNLDGSLRINNFYGQNKSSALSSISERLVKRWGPYLKEFDDERTVTALFDYKNDRENLLKNSVFEDVITFKTQGSSNGCGFEVNDHKGPTNTVSECTDSRYIQVSEFRKSKDDGYVYIMLVNMRCSPFLNESDENSSGGRRFVCIKLKGNILGGQTTGIRLTDLFDNSVIAETGSGKDRIIDLGWFMPGEGRLLKLEPAKK